MKGLFGLAAIAGLSFCNKAPPPKVAADPPPDLDRRAEEAAKEGAGAGKLLGEVRRGVSYETSTHTDFKLSLFDRFCYVVAGVGDDTVARLELSLRDDENKVVGHASPKSATAQIALCPETSGVFHLDVRVSDGAGHFAVAIWKKGKPGDAAPPAEADLENELAAEAEKAAKGATRVGGAWAGSASDTEWPATLDKGACYVVVGVASPPAAKALAVTIVDEKNKTIVEQRSSEPRVTATICPAKGGAIRVRASRTGDGTYKFGLFKKP